MRRRSDGGREITTLSFRCTPSGVTASTGTVCSIYPTMEVTNFGDPGPKFALLLVEVRDVHGASTLVLIHDRKP